MLSENPVPGPGTYDPLAISLKRRPVFTSVSSYPSCGKKKKAGAKNTSVSQAEVGPATYSPDVSITRRKTNVLMLYHEPRSACKTGDQISKYINEIRELREAERLGPDGTVRPVAAKLKLRKLSRNLDTTIPTGCSFGSRTKKCETIPDSGVPGPGAYDGGSGSFVPGSRPPRSSPLRAAFGP